jgi:hypothetical protein
MTVPTLANPDIGEVAAQHHATTFAIHDGFGRKPNYHKKDNSDGTSSHVYEGVAVFRSGTFADSMGYENTWEKIHLDQMVANWTHLVESGTFANVPVRDGHPGWIINGQAGNGKVVGWHTNLRVEELEAPHDGEKYHYLLADYEILDDDAAANISKGLWRNRSSEIGAYRTNNQSEHWPVYMGVAYVDIPAVEGLNFSASKPAGIGPQVYVMFDQKEKNVGDTSPAAPQQGASQPAGTQQHGAPAAPAQPQVFSVNGQNISDFAAVQAHITALEKFQSDTQEANRKGFVTALCAANKLPVTKKDSYEAFALGLSPEQYTAWTATFDDVEVPALLGQHGMDGGVANGGQAPAAQHAANGSASEIVQLKEQVAMHTRAGTAKKSIEQMGSYKRLIALDPSFKL